MKHLLFFASFLISSVSFAETAVPDFSVQIGQEQNANAQNKILNFLPPKNFHFNIEAPMKVSGNPETFSFTKVGATSEHVGYRADSRLPDGAKVTAELYVCDDQKTMCVRKALSFPLTINSDLKKLSFPAETVIKTNRSADSESKSKKKSTKDERGFWNNDADSAIAEAVKTKRPILIDFYGIWCPPCNLYNETVFPRKEFLKGAKNWVLLKMDADKPESFDLKSHFKIGGYPTLVEVKAPTTTDPNSLSEIDRIVGYYPLHEFLKMLDTAYANRSLTLDEKLVSQKSDYLKTLQELLFIKMDQHEWKSALALAKEGERLSGEDHLFPVSILLIQSEEKPGLLKEKSSVNLLNDVYANRKKEKTETLVNFETLLTAKSGQFSKTQIAWMNDVLDELATRIITETLSIPGVELSIADIDSMRVDVAEALNDPSLIQKANVQAAASYQKMITALHLENSRGMNLELAHYLWVSGQVDQAKAIYEKFIKLYPAEFTFYYAASKMYLELKDLPAARDAAEKAFQYAYGDNKLRSAERLVRVLIAQGEKTLAVKRGNEVLSENKPVSDALDVRTNHYIKALKKAVDDAQGATEKGKS